MSFMELQEFYLIKQTPELFQPLRGSMAVHKIELIKRGLRIHRFEYPPEWCHLL